MAQDTWAHKYSATQVRAGKHVDLVPYLIQLSETGVATEKTAFYTRRSFTHVGDGGAKDPLNQGWMVIGGGEESTDLYTGTFQTVKVLSDDWYSTNLRAIIVGNTDPIAARTQGPRGMPTNSIIDSGTNSLNISQLMLQAIISKFTPAQQALLHQSIFAQQNLVPASDLDLTQWPSLTFVLQGDAGDVRLTVAPSDYWQLNTQTVGMAAAAITPGEAGLAILGLPLMNGYFTIFDGTADGGKGVVKFATRKG
jgi:hypothetical protein